MAGSSAYLHGGPISGRDAQLWGERDTAVGRVIMGCADLAAPGYGDPGDGQLERLHGLARRAARGRYGFDTRNRAAIAAVTAECHGLAAALSAATSTRPASGAQNTPLPAEENERIFRSQILVD
ncbi:MAG: hypothetical protein ACRDTD_31530, partial [Pseudonocardiaceae bacterium]